MLRRFSADRRGIAAVEFALLAPIMILLYCGLAELTMAMMAERQAAHSASVVGDLVAQSTQVTGSDVTDIFSVGASIMKPFPAAALQMRLTSVKADANAVPRVVWSQGYGMGTLAANTTPGGFPPSLLAAGDSVIQADVSYSYTSPIQQLLPHAISYSEKFYFKPRRSTEVTYTP
jgi:Flp pilus assembly protein TadG